MSKRDEVKKEIVDAWIGFSCGGGPSIDACGDCPNLQDNDCRLGNHFAEYVLTIEGLEVKK
ncbi:MAG: hypothetical protein HQ578_06845 [Chloroflexi bacterium]|nr:hypothetical protein [Chloroflexota bacterium]